MNGQGGKRRKTLSGIGFRRLAVVAATAVLAACGMADPHLHEPAIFQRDHPDFAKTDRVRDEVVVCYAKSSTSAAAVARIARDACVVGGRGIQYRGNTYLKCPLATPIGAVFSCVGGVTRAGAVPAGEAPEPVAGTVAGQPGAPLAGYRPGTRPLGLLFGMPSANPGPSPVVPAPVPPAPAVR